MLAHATQEAWPGNHSRYGELTISGGNGVFLQQQLNAPGPMAIGVEIAEGLLIGVCEPRGTHISVAPSLPFFASADKVYEATFGDTTYSVYACLVRNGQTMLDVALGRNERFHIDFWPT